MKTLIKLLVCVLALVPFTFAQEGLASLPPCALKCLITAVGESPCTLANQTCICTNVQLQSSVQTCVLQTCTIEQSLTTKNFTLSACGAPIRSKVVLGRNVNLILGCISALIAAIRIGYKLAVSRAELGLDDYTLLLTVISGIFNVVAIDRGLFENGLGRDIWTLPFDHITRFGRFFYMVEINYFIEITLIKLSLLFFYKRIFPARNVQRILWGTIAFNCAYGLTFILLCIFQCSPIDFYWTKWDGEHKGKCLNINAIPWAHAAISIALDFWMLAIPLWQLYHLQLATKKKVGVAMMFVVGTFVTIVSIVRLQYLVTYATSSNPTMDQWNITIWSVIEHNVGVICVCMPILRVILVRLLPKILGTTSSNTYDKYPDDRMSKSGGTNVSGSSSVIKYTKTFQIQHKEKGNTDGDEDMLVQMNNLDTSRKVSGHHSDEISL